MPTYPLTPDVAGALSRLAAPRRDRAFPIATQTFSVQRRKEALKRRDRGSAKRFIRPENAAALAAQLPAEEGDRLHAVIAGDFVYCDLLLAIAKASPGISLDVATLSLSRKNVDAITAALDAGQLAGFRLILSHYFQSTSKDLHAAIAATLTGRAGCSLTIARTHCKVALISGAGRVPLVIESSANLRSSGNLEQLTAIADPDLFEFHRTIFERVRSLAQEAPAK